MLPALPAPTEAALQANTPVRGAFDDVSSVAPAMGVQTAAFGGPALPQHFPKCAPGGAD